MDYSTSINDPEHPAGASPWGNSPVSSPQHNRTAFGAAAGEPPNSPFQYPPQSPNNGLQDEGGFGSANSEYRRPGTASTVSAAESYTEESRSGNAPSNLPHDQDTEGYLTGDQGPPPPPQQQQQQHRQQQQIRRPPQPQYKLQAKITGLERTGRKDPILRFDVHV